MSTAFAAYVGDSLKSELFTHIDVGCSGGIDPVWRVFGPRLRAVAFDASLDECERLAREETHAGIKYIGGFVGLPPDHPFARRVAGKLLFAANPIYRTSAWRTLQLRKARLEAASLEEKLRDNLWNLTKLADPAKPVVVPDVLKELGWSDVDLLKIDVEGAELDVLLGLDAETWPRVRQVVIETHNRAGRQTQIERLLAENGFHQIAVAQQRTIDNGLNSVILTARREAVEPWGQPAI